MSISFGREICGELNTAQTREWLVTNGIGGYASGTVSGMLTRSYHGLLVAALKPPLQRTLLVTKLDETVEYYGKTYPLFSNLWQGGIVTSSRDENLGYENIESFRLEGTIPIWTFTLADAVIEKRIWMQHKANTTYVRYTLKRASNPLNLSLKALVNYRSYHGGSLPNLRSQELVNRGVRIIMDVNNPQPFYLLTDKGNISLTNEVYANFQLPIENYRGLNDLDNHRYVANFQASLEVGESLTFVATTENSNPSLEGGLPLNERHDYEQTILKTWQETDINLTEKAPDWIKQLVLAADQFIVDRPLTNNSIGKTVLAGYHWFEDWGRDTMISLPGLALVTGHSYIAKTILETFAEYISQGMLPNRFPDDNSLTYKDYNTVDATLWYFEAIRLYYSKTGDDQFIKDIFPKLKEIIDKHRQGTRYNIKLDENDGLISAGYAGNPTTLIPLQLEPTEDPNSPLYKLEDQEKVSVQLTWMDAIVNGQVITPRRGKPIEINVLWYNALITMSNLAQLIGEPSSEYETMTAKTKQGFERFWNAEKGYCYDVLDVFDTPNFVNGTNDDALRPNQLFAVSLPESPLTEEQKKAIVDVCERFLLTSHGLRSLSPDHAKYIGFYEGNQYHRDIAYHQGTVWGWLIGTFALAHLKVYNNPQQALDFLNPFAYHLSNTGLGTISEIFDGNAPYRSRGCIAQAWSVAEVLRAWTEIMQKAS